MTQLLAQRRKRGPLDRLSKMTTLSQLLRVVDSFGDDRQTRRRGRAHDQLE